MDNCTILAETGGDFSWPLLLVGVLVTVVGVALIVSAKRRTRRPGRAAMAWALAAAVVLGGSGAALVPTQAYAATDNCDTVTTTEPTAPVVTPTPEPTVDPPVDPTDPTDPENPDPVEPEPEAVAPVAAGGAGTVATFEWQNSQRDFVPGSDDQLAIVAAPAFTFDVLANASATAPATLDAATIDLDPSTPGVQRNIETEHLVASVDPATGIITVSLTVPVGSFISIADIEQLLTSVQYTVSDSNGLTSNAATVSISTIITRVAAET
ncbi:LPXTG cell wall anchor domain-containing protein [Microbacterium galbinum]|uniref:LPXTG cell wall anchor domain-containing protein n=1 Tax=Microbacterium galbinum TaxID=2851646 RepID=A0ABY4IUK8_9MICO|nr:LPXTG cell wall anchor domain-containing protein [Microbacterium galbinum]UPL15702.1 LPXTG cell wall anchor domain-containing protein [Microbacterium galbinum]